MKTLTTSIVLCTVLAISGVAQASLVDRGGGLIYDDVLNVTWLQDANYAKTSGYTNNTVSPTNNGLLYSGELNAWITTLSYYDSVRNVTYTDWRLPTIAPSNGSNFNYNYAIDGTTDVGFNITSPNSELAYMFNVNLKANPGLFSNIQPGVYWFGDALGYAFYEPGPFGYVWGFDMGTGFQGSYNSDGFSYGWAVRDGDVAVVPVPAAVWLLGSGLIGLLGIAQQRRK